MGFFGGKLVLFLELIDIFGHESKLLIFGRTKFKTSLGGVLTLVYIFLFLLLFFSLSANMMKRQNPDSTISELFKSVPSSSKVGPDDYFFMFGLQRGDTFGHFYDPSIYTLSFENQGVKVPFETCREDHIPTDPELNKFFRTAHYSNLSDLLCIKKENQSSFIVRGEWSNSDTFNFFQIRISPCINNTNIPEDQRIVCKPTEVLEDYLGSGFFAFYSTDTLIDVTNFDQPGRRVGLNYYIESGLTLGKQIVRYISTNTLLSDNGWITEEYQEDEYTSFARDRESLFLIKEEKRYSTTFVEFQIRKAVYEKLFKRKYLKIQAVMAYMGGFLQLIFVGLWILTKPYVKKHFNDRITNSTFNFEAQEKEKVSKKKVKIKKEAASGNVPVLPAKPKSRLSEILKSGDLSSSNFIPGGKKLTESSLEKKLASEMNKIDTKPLHITITQLLRTYFSNKSDLEVKKKQRRKGILNILQKLDISNLLHKLTEIDKLKMILFDEDQYNLFHLLPKPYIQKDSTISFSAYKVSNDKSAESFFEHDNVIVKTKLAQTALKNILNKKALSHMDCKILAFIHPEIKEALFDEYSKRITYKSMENIEKSHIKATMPINKDETPRSENHISESKAHMRSFENLEKSSIKLTVPLIKEGSPKTEPNFFMALQESKGVIESKETARDFDYITNREIPIEKFEEIRENMDSFMKRITGNI